MRALWGTLALFILLPAALQAQERESPRDTLPRYLLEGVTVTTTRAPVARDALPQQIEVVTETDMERTPALELADVLKKTAGVDVIQYSALLSGVSIRGFRPQFSGINPRTLVLVDGRPAGATNLSAIDLAAAERIEVLKGPASALYGSSAMGGVVNIVTRESQGPIRSRLSAAYGSFETFDGELTSGGSLTSALDFDLALSVLERSAGYRLGSNRAVGSDEVVKTLRNGSTERLPDLHTDTVLAFSEQGYRAGSLRLGYALADAWRVEARGGAFVASEVQNPGDLNVTFYSTQSLNDLERYTGDVAITGAVGRHAPTLRVYASREVSSYYDSIAPPTFVSFRTPIDWYGAQLQDAISLGDHSLVVGTDYAVADAQSERFTAEGVAAPTYSPGSIVRSAAAFAQGRLAFLDERLVATLGGRLDRIAFEVAEGEFFGNVRVAANTETHTVFNPSAGLQYRTPLGLRLHATAGRAFVTPDAFNVAGYSERPAGAGAVAIAVGNPALDPESSVSWDAGVGLARPLSGIELDLTYFQTDVRDRITSRFDAPGSLQLTPAGDTVRSITSYVNVDEAEIRGLEAQASYDLGALADYRYSLRLFAAGTRFLRAEEISGGAAARIKNVADLNVNFGADFDDLERFSARLAGRYVGDRTDADFTDFMNPGDVLYPAFMVFDLSTAVRFGDRYQLGLVASNLTDENYYEVRGYTLPGRALRVKFAVEF